MPTTCVVFGCSNRAKAGSGISFHRFPFNDPDRLQKWKQAVRRKDWAPKKSSWICGEHFEQSCFVVRPGKHGCRLYDHAIPKIFPKHLPHLQTKVTKRKSPKKRPFVEPVPVMSLLLPK